MSKLLDKAIAKARQLPEDEQDALAAVMLLMAEDASGVPLDRDTEAAIREGLAQAERGEFVADEVVAASNKRHGL